MKRDEKQRQRYLWARNIKWNKTRKLSEENYHKKKKENKNEKQTIDNLVNKQTKKIQRERKQEEYRN